MIGIIVSAALLCLIMFIVARHEADYSFPKVILISLGLGLCNMMLSLFVGPWVALIVVLGLTVCALNQFCYLRWSKAGLITGIYVMVQVVLGVVFGAITSL